MAQKKTDASALRGKLIRAGNLVGKVLNDPGDDGPIALQVLREKQTRQNDTIALFCGWAPTSSWWEERDQEVHFTREQLGPFEVLEKMPDYLQAKNLNRMTGRPLTTMVNGRNYIDW